MTQRLVQLSVKDAASEELEAYCAPASIVSIVRDQKAEGQLLVQMTVDTDDSEQVLDRLQQVFGTSEGFHIAVLPIEALLPRPAEDESENAEKVDKRSQRISREELFQEISAGLDIRNSFVNLVLLSSVVAAIGLYRNDTAILIGAMVIAPLLLPNVALSLAAVLGDTQLAKRAFFINLLGVSLSLVTAVIAGALLGVDPGYPAILSRSDVGMGDLLLALAAGVAGVLSFTSVLPSALIGVMVAVALMPPLVAFGMLLGAGHFQASLGPLMLLSANVICLNLAGVVTFASKGIRPRTWWESRKARGHVWIAAVVWTVLLMSLVAILWLQDNIHF